MQQILGDTDEQEPLPDLYWSKIRRALKPFIYFAGANRDIRFIHGAFYEVIWYHNDGIVFECLDFWLILELLFFSWGCIWMCSMHFFSAKFNKKQTRFLQFIPFAKCKLKKTPCTSLKKYWIFWFLSYRMPRCYILKRKRLRLCTIPLLSII